MLELLVVAMLMASLLVNVLLAVLLYLKGKEKQQLQVKVKAEDELQLWVYPSSDVFHHSSCHHVVGRQQATIAKTKLLLATVCESNQTAELTIFRAKARVSNRLIAQT